MFRRIIILFTLGAFAASAQVSPDSIASENFLFSRKFISVAGVSGIYVGTILDSYYTWWNDDKRPFTMHSGPWIDKNGDNGIDKLGHLFTSYLFYKVQKDLFLWGGYSDVTSRTLSASLSFMMALIIEIGDGYSRYGFDYKDLLSNCAGLGYALLQDDVPYLRNINLKWSYIPTSGFTFPPRFSNHYEGHVYWVTFDLHNMLGEETGSFWPEIIQPAVGYSIGKYIESEYIFGIDVNLLPLFRSGDPLVGYLGDIVNLFHLPSPGVKFTADKKPEYRMFLLH